MRLADLLTHEQHAIEERWLACVRPLAPREGLTREELVDSLPAFLEELSRALRHLEDSATRSALPERSPVAEVHGQQRHRLGYATESVAREYPLLHEVILLVAAKAGVSVSAWEGILLARCMGTASAEALSHFAAAGEEALRQSAGRTWLEQASHEEQILRVRAAEQQARESEARMRAILASLEEGVGLHDAQGTILFANAAATRHLGLPLEQLQGRTPFDPRWRAVREDGSDYPGAEHPHMRALRTGQPVVGDVIGIHRPDGQLVWLSVNAQPLLGSNGGPPLGAVSSFADITAPRQTAAELRASEERYRTLVESLDEGFCLVELILDDHGEAVDYRFLETNAAFEAHTGKQSVVGRTTREVVPDLDEAWPRLLASVVATGTPVRIEDYTPALGRWFNVFATRVGPPELRHVAILFTDITARKRREAHLALLAELSEDFARLVPVDDIMQTVGAKLGAYLALTNLNLVDVDEAGGTVTVEYNWARAGTPSLVRTYRIDEYLSEEITRASRAGETVVVRDTQSDPRTDAAGYAALEIGAFITVPFHEAGKWKAWVTVCDGAARDWREDEIELVRGLADRLFPRLERARAEAALRQSEERYRTLFTSMDESFCIIELVFDEAERPIDFRYVEVNPSFERHTGLRGALGRTVRELVPDIEPFWFEIYGKVALTGEPTRFEDHAVSMGRWFHVYAFRVGQPEERKVALLFNDITARKQAEAAAEAERQKLRDIFEQAPVLIAIVEGPAYTFTFANPAYRTLLGGLDVVGKPAREVLPEFEGQLGAIMNGVLASGVPFVGREVPVRMPHHAPGEDRYFDFAYQPMRDALGRVHGILACGYDVTDQVRARKQVQRLAAQLESILQSFPEPLFFVDAAGAFRANAPGLRLLGVASVEELPSDVAILHEKLFIRRADTGEPLQKKDNMLVRALEGHTSFLEYILRDPITGKDRVLRGAGAPVRLGEEVIGGVAFSTDITERIRAEQAMRERADFEEKLIGIVGHDLRQPLQTISMSAGILLMRPGLDARALAGVQRITAAAARMQRMLHDILDFTRARLGGGIPLARVQSDVARLAQEAAEELQLVHAGRRVEIRAEGDGEGRWDADRLRQVLDNLLTNALAYSPAGSPVRLEVDGQKPDEVRVHVHNAGAPIPADVLPVLFQPLTRGTGAGGAERSVGLGLFIVHHIVEAHGGRVEVASSEAEGTTFSVRLPRG